MASRSCEVLPPFLFCLGEILVDLMAVDGQPLCRAQTFKRFWGGSVTNVAASIALLGHTVMLAAAVGADPLGQFLQESLAQTGVDTSPMQVVQGARTSVVLISCETSPLTAISKVERTPDSQMLHTKMKPGAKPEFLPFHDAHRHLSLAGLNPTCIQQARVVHTSAFSLAREPLCSAVLWALTVAQKAGVLTSLDANYRQRLWQDPEKGRAVMRLALQRVDSVKVSEEDASQFLGESLPPDKVITRYHTFGPQQVVFTAGAQGMWISDDGAMTHIPAVPVKEVVHEVGAGDAFWAGFLSGILDDLNTVDAVRRGAALAAHKLGHYGPLTEPLDRFKILDF